MISADLLFAIAMDVHKHAERGGLTPGDIRARHKLTETDQATACRRLSKLKLIRKEKNSNRDIFWLPDQDIPERLEKVPAE